MRDKNDPRKFPLVQYYLPEKDEIKRAPKERLQDTNEIYEEYSIQEARVQAQRCLDCAIPLCQTKGCPLQNDIPLWLRKVAEGNILEAAKLSLATSNMPEICGRVCPQGNLCEGSCNIEHLWGAVHIGKIEKYLNDYAFRHFGGIPLPDPLPKPSGFTVACVGAGPASIACADELSKHGHKVVMYDIYPKPGGTLTYGIPGFKLEKKHVIRRMDYLEKLGVEFHGNTRVGKDIPFAELAKNYDAVFIGIGATLGTSPGVEGENLKGVFQATEFLSRANLPADWLPDKWKEPLPKPEGDTCITFGGGDTSTDCIRTAVRLGYKRSMLIYRRGPQEMPANPRDFNSALEEGVEAQYFTAPKRFLGDANGRVRAVECFKMKLGEPEADGRRKPVKIENSEFTIDCDRVVLALGYNNDGDIPKQTPELRADKWGTLKIDERTGRTSMANVFAGGDASRGADLVVTAVADGRRGARAILEFFKLQSPKHSKILTKPASAEAPRLQTV